MDRLTEQGAVLSQLLKDRGETIAIAESSTGGLVSAALLAVPGASNYFLGGGIFYTRAARRGLLEFSEFEAQMRAATQRLRLPSCLGYSRSIGLHMGHRRERRYRTNG